MNFVRRPLVLHKHPVSQIEETGVSQSGRPMSTNAARALVLKIPEKSPATGRVGAFSGYLLPHGHPGLQGIDGVAHGSEGRSPVGGGHGDDNAGFGHGDQAATERRTRDTFSESAALGLTTREDKSQRGSQH